MSAVIGRPPTVAHDINPYIPDILRPSPVTSFQSLHRDVPSPASRSSLASLDTSALLNINPSEAASLLARHPRPFESHPSTAASCPSFPQCVRCHESIKDHYLYRIRGATWHEACALCSTCSAPLSDVCFLHEGQLYCRRDYDRLHARKCVNCRQPMRSHELFMRAPHPPTASHSHTESDDSLIFHVSCFTCTVCLQPLAAGDQYVIDPDSKRPVCQADFMAAQRNRPSSSPTSSSPLLQRPSLSASAELPNRPSCVPDQLPTSDPSVPAVAFGAARRMRTSLTEEQRIHLQQAYEVNSRPPKQTRERLAHELSVPVRVVQVWFQNQRARDKRGRVPPSRRRSTHPQQHQPATDPAGQCYQPSRSISPGTTAMTPSPRTSIESGPWPEFGGYSSDNHGLQPSVTEPHNSQQPWMPPADTAWFTGPDNVPALSTVTDAATAHLRS